MSAKTLGILLITVGLLMMIYTGFTYMTTKRVVDLGPVKINKEEQHPVQWSPIVGFILFAGGIVVIVSNKNKN